MSILTEENIKKYLLQSVIISVLAYVLPRRKVSLEEIAIIGASSGLSFMLLDKLSLRS